MPKNICVIQICNPTIDTMESKIQLNCKIWPGGNSKPHIGYIISFVN